MRAGELMLLRADRRSRVRSPTGTTAMAVDIREGSRAAARAETASIEEVVMLLRAVLGPELVASIAGNKTRGCVAAWAQGRDHPGDTAARRLRIALELVLVVMEGEGIEAARSWLLRPDRTLEGRSPLAVLAEQRPLRTRRTLLAAAAASLRRGDAGPSSVSSGRPLRSV
jgi:hypothetical protein